MCFVNVLAFAQDVAMANDYDNLDYHDIPIYHINNVPDCTEPESIFIVNTYGSDIRLEWADMPAQYDDIRYQVRYRRVKGREVYTKWKVQWVYEGNSTLISELEKSSEYEFEIRRICDGSGEEFALHSSWVNTHHATRGSGIQDSLCDLFNGGLFFLNLNGSFTIHWPQALAEKMAELGYNWIIQIVTRAIIFMQ